MNKELWTGFEQKNRLIKRIIKNNLKNDQWKINEFEKQCVWWVRKDSSMIKDMGEEEKRAENEKNL